MKDNISLRPIIPEDKDFLYLVYASTREEELAPLGWNSDEKEKFLRMQFNAQHRFYQERFSNAEFQVICLDSRPIGRLYVDRRGDEIRIVDIALLPEYRNSGIGTSLLEALLAEAARKGLPVRIHVEHFNRALHLYKRLGFVISGENGVYYLLEWTPPSSCSSASVAFTDKKNNKEQ
ncbi:MAG: GNAT family N-acetyltransferase [bacterium]